MLATRPQPETQTEPPRSTLADLFANWSPSEEHTIDCGMKFLLFAEDLAIFEVDDSEYFGTRYATAEAMEAEWAEIVNPVSAKVGPVDASNPF